MIIPRVPNSVYKSSRSTVKSFDTAYQNIKSLLVRRSIDGVCGEFRITISRPPKSRNPFQVGDTIDIQLEGNQVMRGKIYEVVLEGDAATDAITFLGRDITGDLIDSTVPDGSKVYEAGVNISDIAGSIIRAKELSVAIGVLNLTGGDIEPFSGEEIVSCKIGDTVIGFLQKYCRKRQLFLNTDTAGNLVFFKADGIRTGNKLTNETGNDNNNIISWKAKHDISGRFYKYICRTQDSDIWHNSGADIKEVETDGEAIDGAVSRSREKEFKAEESLDSTECKERAAEEANVRRARSFEYTVEVQGFKDKVLWAVNQFVSVSDDKAAVSGEFLIKEVLYTIDNRRGRLTRLTIVNRDAYTAQAAISLRDAQMADEGTGWVNKAKDGVTEIASEIAGDIRTALGVDD